MRNRFLGGASLYAMILMNAEGGSGGGGDPTPTPNPTPTPTPESVLFPKETPTPEPKPTETPAGDPPPADKGAGDWKEYENDPAKSDAENAAAKAEHDKTKPADDVADKVPEDGKYTLSMPEGVELDAELLEAVSPRFKELGLTNKQAQALTDDFIKLQTDRHTAKVTDWANRVSGWVDQAKADKDIGGTKWDGTVRDATRAVNTLGTPELKEYLEATGGGNHPELIRFMSKVGAMIKEDTPATDGAGGRGKPAEAAHLLFPNDAPKGS